MLPTPPIFRAKNESTTNGSYSRVRRHMKRKAGLAARANKKRLTAIIRTKPASSADSQQSTPDSFASEGDEEEENMSSILFCLEESTSLSSSSSSTSSSGVSSLLLPDQRYRHKPLVINVPICSTDPLRELLAFLPCVCKLFDKSDRYHSRN